MPWVLQTAIDQAIQIMSWHEHLPKEDVPPEHLWEDAEGLEQWWQDVENKREDGVPTKRGRDAPDSGGDSEEHMVENDYARYLKQS